MLARALCALVSSKLPSPSISEVAQICGEILRPLSPAQPCLLVWAAWMEEQWLQFWDFWMRSLLSSDRALKKPLRAHLQGEGGSPASPPPSPDPQCLGSEQQIRSGWGLMSKDGRLWGGGLKGCVRVFSWSWGLHSVTYAQAHSHMQAYTLTPTSFLLSSQ